MPESASPRAAEPNTIAFFACVKWGARLRFSASRSRMMAMLMSEFYPEECPGPRNRGTSPLGAAVRMALADVREGGLCR